jgi:TPR repeat protein
MADDQHEKPQVVRFPEPPAGAAPGAEERRVAEIARDIEELGRALKDRDRLASFGTAERAKSSPAQERARTQELEQQLAAREDTTLDRDRAATASPSDRPASMPPAPTPDKPVTDPLPASDKPVMPANHKSRTRTARPTTPEAPGNLEAARLMAQARLLLDQGDIIAARSVLERGAESGIALALYLLAETYDPAILSDWGIFRRRGDVTKAQKLYAKAVDAGVHEAKYRLSALRSR